MKAYVTSLAVGVLVGVIYNLFNVRSPAPPLVALVGLLGMLGGEQVIPTVKQAVARYTPTAVWQQVKCATPFVFGVLPGCGPDQDPASLKLVGNGS
jgi:XapX domain-containing protein